MRGALLACALALVAACQFQPRGAEIDASGNGDGDAAIDPDATNNPDPDASAIDASTAIDARSIDAAIDAASCPVECNGGCMPDGTCVINCGSLQCNSGVRCPSGRPCDVNCTGTGACEMGVVDCTQATRCDITCSGTDACDAGVNCAGSVCTVQCSGTAACEDGGVDCTAQDCNITCSGTLSCADHVCCSGANCGNDCNSSGGGCCACNGC